MSAPHKDTSARENRYSTVSITDIAKGLPDMIPDLPSVFRGLFLLRTIRSHHKRSIGQVFEQNVDKAPDRPFLKFADDVWTYREANERVNEIAAVLDAQGVRSGDTVGVCITNRPEALLAVLATVKLGASAGMINVHQRGDVLDHSQGLLDSKVMLIGAECEEAYLSLPGSSKWCGTVIGVDTAHDLRVADAAAGERPDAMRDLPWLDDLVEQMGGHASTVNPPSTPHVLANQTAYQVFTSGTTGMPKASKMTHLRWNKAMVAFGLSGARLRSTDTLYCPLPLYHNNALTVALSAVLGAGGCLAIGEKFSAKRFWDEIVGFDATAFIYIGELCRYLLGQPVRPQEREHNLRMIMGNGLRPEIWKEFQERFNIPRVCEFYAASESPVAFVNAFSVDSTAGFTTVPHKIVKVDTDTEELVRNKKGWLVEARPGEVGQMIGHITRTTPFDGYTNSAATEKKIVRDAFKKGDAWFLSGDLVFNQGFNHIAFVDRLGDTFRWKGENVATTEVEGAFGGVDGVDTATVYGVQIPGTDGRAGMAALTLKDGVDFDGKAYAEALTGSLPTYAVPLFIRIIEELEETSTFKVRKTDLKKDGYDATRFDDPLYVLSSKDCEYVPYYDGAEKDVAAGSVSGGK